MPEPIKLPLPPGQFLVFDFIKNRVYVSTVFGPIPPEKH